MTAARSRCRGPRRAVYDRHSSAPFRHAYAETEREEEHEAADLEQRERAALEARRDGEEQDGLGVEEHEEHRDGREPHARRRPRLAGLLHAALVGRVLARAGVARRQEDVCEEDHEDEARRRGGEAEHEQQSLGGGSLHPSPWLCLLADSGEGRSDSPCAQRPRNVREGLSPV